MPVLRPLLPLLAAAALGAADQARAPLAHTADGAAIAAGESYSNGAGPVRRIELDGLRRGHLDLRPDSLVTLTTEPGDRPGRQRLVVELERGAVRLDLDGTGPWQDVRVRGAAVDVTVTGTLFMVERVQRDADYVSLLRGHLVVGLRRAVAEALHQDPRIDLDSRQGVGGSTAGGLGPVTSITAPPSLAAKGADAGDPGWGDGAGDLGDLDLPFDDLAGDLGESALDELGGPGGVGDDLLTVVGGGFILGGPPGHP